MADQPKLDIVYAPSGTYGIFFAERETAEYYGRIARAVRDSTTWGEFRNALPENIWEEEFLSNFEDDEPDDDEPFPADEYQYGYNDGQYIGGWPTEDELSWFPKDLIEKYKADEDHTGPDYELLYFPDDADADAIAEDLRARGHKVEKDVGHLTDWLDLVGA
jgi:hypothetical protein